MSCQAEAHLRNAERLLGRLSCANPERDPQAVLATFRQLINATEAGLSAVDDEVAPEIARSLEAIHCIVLEVGAAGVAAGVIERVRVIPGK